MARSVDIHLIADNYSRHKHEKARKRLEHKKRFHVHFTPTSGSWMNLVERFIAGLAEQCLRPDRFTSLAKLVKAITVYLAQRNANPQPYRCKAKGKDLLEKIQRARTAMDQQLEQSTGGC